MKQARQKEKDDWFSKEDELIELKDSLQTENEVLQRQNQEWEFEAASLKKNMVADGSVGNQADDQTDQ